MTKQNSQSLDTWTVVSDFYDSIRKEYESKGNSPADAYAYTLGYVSGSFRTVIDSLPAYRRNQVLKDLVAIAESKRVLVA